MAEYKSAYTGPQIDAAIAKANTATQPADLASKQDTLVSGTNIKTINNTSLLGSGNITIEGGGSDVSVREIDYSNPEEWNSSEQRPTTAVIDDILANKYTLIHVYNIEIDEDVMVEMYLVSSTIIDVEESGVARYYYKFDEGDEGEGTSPNIEQYLFIHQEGEGAQMIVETFELGGGDVSWGSITGTLSDQTDLQNALDSKQASLVSGTNIKTINNENLLGSGNINISGGSGIQEFTPTSIDLEEGTIEFSSADFATLAAGEDLIKVNISLEDPSNPSWIVMGLAATGEGVAVYSTFVVTMFDYDEEVNTHNVITITITDDSGSYDGTIQQNRLADITDLDEKQDTLVSGTNIKTINNTSLLGSGNISITTDEGLKEVYVNAATGSDSNDGTNWANAKQTFASALAAASDDCTLYFEGDTNERLNIKTNANQKVLRVVGRDGVRNRILCGTKLVDFEATQTTGVYKIATPSETAFSSNYYSIVQDNVADTSTEITSYEAHPAQKGRQYRLLSTPIPRQSSIASVISSTKGFYYDGTYLYVKPVSTDFANHPIYCPTENGGIYGNDGSCLVEITNVEVWNAPLLITNCPDAKLTDCTCCFALGTGGIKYDDSVGVTLTRCEAAYTLNTSGYGDGINAHSSKYEAASGSNPQTIKYVSAELIDCWCHDCSDDGWSDHSGCEVVIRGGLYEYNHKGGVTPSNGGKCTCYDVMTRKNCRGFYYVSAGSQKEKTAYFYCENCVSDGEDANRVSQGITRLAGAGFSTDDIGVSVSGWKGIYSKFVNCKSMNNDIGFGAGKKSVMALIDCGTQTVTSRMSTLNDGVITPYSTTNIAPGTNVTGVTLSQTTKAVDYNQTFTLTADITPSNATNKNVTWDIPLGGTYISIVPNGLNCAVTSGSTNGSAAVRVTTEDGSYTAQCAITVAHKELSSLSYTGTLETTSYQEGDHIDVTGLTFTATFDDSSTQQLTASDLVFNPDPLTLGTTSVTASYTYGSVTKSTTITGITVTSFISASDFAYGAVKNDGSVDTTTPQALNNIYQKNIKQFSNYKITPLTDNVIWKVVYYDANGGYISNSGWMCRVQNQYATIASDYDITPAAYARICIANDVQVTPGTYTVQQMFERVSITENS